MTTEQELQRAMFAYAVYDASDRNRMPLGDWQIDTDLSVNIGWSGFVATVYRRGTEVVVSFRGTDGHSVLPSIPDWLIGNAPAAGGIYSHQVMQAINVVADVLDRYEATSDITFTGHSLGGGLASLMGAFFNKETVIFDPAPFGVTAQNRMVLPGGTAPIGMLDVYHSAYVVRQLLMGRVTSTAFDQYVSTFTDGSLSERDALYAQRLSGITGYYLEGEVLVPLRVALPTAIEDAVLEMVPTGDTNLGGTALHSMSLLTALMASTNLRDATLQLSTLLEQLTDENLYGLDTRDEELNVLNGLLQDHFQSGMPQPGSALDRFGADLLKLVGADGAVQNSASLQSALIVTAIEYYYFRNLADAPAAFGESNGAIHFKYSDIGAEQYRSLPLLASAVANAGGSIDPALIAILRGQNAWHLQSGSGSMVWLADTADPQNDVALGGTSNDTLSGGVGTDVLFGGGGIDVLEGGDGADWLYGGMGDDVLFGNAGMDRLYGGHGFDQYHYTTGDGIDVIEDSDGLGVIFVNGVALSGANAELTTYRNRRAWQLDIGGQNAYIIEWAGSVETQATLRIEGPAFGPDGFIEVQKYTPDALGLTLDTANTTRALVGNGQLREGLASQLQLVLATFAGTSQVVRFQASDLAANLQLVTGAEALSFNPDGTLDVTLEAGQAAFNYALLSHGNVDADASVTLSAVLLDADGNPTGDVANLDINFDATDEVSPVNAQYGGIVGPTEVWYGQSALVHSALGDPDRHASEWYDTSTRQPLSGYDFLPVHGGLGDTYVIGSPYRDVIEDGYNIAEFGANGGPLYGGDNDILYGGLGDDVIQTHGGNDRAYGGDGNDLIVDTPREFNWQSYGSTDWVNTPGHSNEDQLFGEAGNDIIVANAGNALLDGDIGDDQLYGGGDDDTLLGGDGNDILWGDSLQNDPLWLYVGGVLTSATDIVDAGRLADFGGVLEQVTNPGRDFLDGGDGDDELRGGGNDDVLFGGAGNDSLVGDAGDSDPHAGDDYLNGEDGNDRLWGNAGADTLVGGQGDDILQGGEGDDALFGGADNDLLIGGNGHDVLYGESGVDELQGGEGDDFLDGGDDNDVLFGEEGDDILEGGAGDDHLSGDVGNDYLFGDAGADELQGGDGDDVLLGGDGADRLFGQEGIDTLFGGADNDALLGGSGNDHLFGEAGLDQLQGGDGDDLLDGGAEDDTLFGEAGADQLFGGEGNDGLVGGDGDDTLIGGLGTDYLSGDAGNDTYILSAADMAPINNMIDVISDTSGANRIVFEDGITRSNIIVQRGSGGNIQISNSTGTAAISIQNLLNGGASYRFEFAGGDSVDAAQLIGENLNSSLNTSSNEDGAFLLGGAANDSILGSGSGATLSGGHGNDVLTGSSEQSTTYLFRFGYGEDSIIDQSEQAPDGSGAVNKLVLADLSLADIAIRDRNGSRSIMVVGGLGGTINLGAAAPDIFDSRTLDQVQFRDGSVMSWSELVVALGVDIHGDLQPIPGQISGTDADDRIVGTSNAETVVAGLGNDVLYGGAGDDHLFGEAGDDTYVIDAAGLGTVFIEDTEGSNTLVTDGVQGSVQSVGLNEGLIDIALVGGTRILMSPDTAHALQSDLYTSELTQNDDGSSHVTLHMQGDDGARLTHRFATAVDGSVTHTGRQFDTDNVLVRRWVHAPDGSITEHTYEGGNVVDSMTTRVDGSTVHRTFVYGVGASRIVTSVATSADGDVTTTVDEFGEDGRLAVKTVNRSDGGNTVHTYQYDVTGVLTARVSVDSDGAHTLQTYDATGALTERVVTLADGTVTTYRYNTAGAFDTVDRTNPDGSTSSKTYAYHADGSMTVSDTITTPSEPGVTTIVSDYNSVEQLIARLETRPDGSTVARTFVYGEDGSKTVTSVATDAAGSVTTTVLAYTADARLVNRVVTRPDGVVIEFDYDANGVVIHTLQTDPDGASVDRTYEFSPNGARTVTTVNMAAGAEVGTTTVLTYDELDNLRGNHVTHSDGSETRSLYDTSGRVTHRYTTHLDGSLTTERSVYADDGTTTNTTSTTLDDELVGASITRTFDVNGVLRARTIVDPNGESRDYRYDETGRLVSLGQRDTDGAAISRNYVYQPDGGRIETVATTAPGASVARIVINRYDAAGALIGRQVTDVDGSIVVTQYDSDGSVAASETRQSDGVTLLRSYEYREDGSRTVTTNTISATGDAGRVVVSDYDAAGVLISRTVGSETADTTDDGAGNVETRYYSPTGFETHRVWRLADGSSGEDRYGMNGSSYGTVRQADGSYSMYADDGLGNVTTKYFDAQGVVLISAWQHNDGSAGTEQFYADGTVEGHAQYADGTSSYTRVDAVGRTTTYRDADGNWTRADFLNADGSYGTYLFSPNGELLSGEIFGPKLGQRQVFIPQPNGGMIHCYSGGQGETSVVHYAADMSILSQREESADGRVEDFVRYENGASLTTWSSPDGAFGFAVEGASEFRGLSFFSENNWVSWDGIRFEDGGWLYGYASSRTNGEVRYYDGALIWHLFQEQDGVVSMITNASGQVASDTNFGLDPLRGVTVTYTEGDGPAASGVSVSAAALLPRGPEELSSYSGGDNPFTDIYQRIAANGDTYHYANSYPTGSSTAVRALSYYSEDPSLSGYITWSNGQYYFQGVNGQEGRWNYNPGDPIAAPGDDVGSDDDVVGAGVSGGGGGLGVTVVYIGDGTVTYSNGSQMHVDASYLYNSSAYEQTTFTGSGTSAAHSGNSLLESSIEQLGFGQASVGNPALTDAVTDFFGDTIMVDAANDTDAEYVRSLGAMTFDELPMQPMGVAPATAQGSSISYDSSILASWMLGNSMISSYVGEDSTGDLGGEMDDRLSIAGGNEFVFPSEFRSQRTLRGGSGPTRYADF